MGLPASLSSGARLPIPTDLRKRLKPLFQRANTSQIPIYLVGGCVRDLLLGKMPLDIDVVIEGPADLFAKAVAKAYKAKLIRHPQFLTYTLLLKGDLHLDIATARVETYAECAALPVVEPASLQDDLYRRDFSINAIALSLNESDFGHIWDPFGGVEDLRAGKIRVLHAESFKDDPTRVFRAARFAGRFDYELDWRTREWLTECVAQQWPARLSGARLREELVPILMEKDPRAAFRLLEQWSALPFLVPNLHWGKSHDTFFGQLVRSSGSAKHNPLLLRLLVLLHTIPYPKAVGSLGHLMFPQSLIAAIEQALTVLSELREGRLSLRATGKTGRRPMNPVVKTFIEKAMRVRSFLPKKEPAEQWKRYQDSEPRLTGRDVRDLGYQPGPVFTKIFDALREARWEGKLRTREEEIRFVQATFQHDGQ